MGGPEGGSTGVVRIHANDSNGARIVALQPGEVHLMPCSINHNGSAPVSDYFKPQVAADFVVEDAEVKSAAFRGRKLLGCTSELPDGYCGLLLEKVPTGRDSLRSRRRNEKAATAVDVWNTKATFQDITYWRHDENPHSVESGHKFMDWLRLASVMHKPVSAAEVSMEQNATNKEGASGQKRKLQHI